MQRTCILADKLLCNDSALHEILIEFVQIGDANYFVPFLRLIPIIVFANTDYNKKILLKIKY